MARIQVSNDPSGRIIVSFPYDPLLVSKIKTIEGRRWHPAEKHWSFHKLDGMLKKILKVFEGEEIHLDSALKGTGIDFVVSTQSNDLQSPLTSPPHRWGREREGVKKLESPACPVGRGLSPKFDFKNIRRELVSRKYSYKTIIFRNSWGNSIAKRLKSIPM